MIIILFFLIFELTDCDIVEVQTERLRQSCQSKSTGYFWNGQQCLKCRSPNCLCQSEGGCTSCIDNYYYDTKTTNCVPCPKGCQNCCKNDLLTEFVCTLCQSGYRNINGVCVYMGICSMISMHGRCIQCDSGYYQDYQFICQKCGQGCEDCSNLAFCNKCSDGYRLQNQNQKMICQQCTQKGCKICENDVCSSCQLGYYMFGAECIQCLTDCDSCTSTTTCIACNFYAVLNDEETKCQRCQDIYKNCLKCDPSEDEKSFICAACENGYYMDKVGQCQPCVSQDSTQTNKNAIRRCESTDVITQCMPGYLLFQNRYNDTTKDIVNILKYDCIKNINNCATIIDTDGQCSTCLQGYILYNINNTKKCITCVQQVTNCEDCYITPSQVFQCIQCSNGYYLNSNGNQCTYCGDNCEICDGLTSCQTCISGYVQDSGVCKSCEVENCDKCTNQKYCDTCYSGFGVSEGNCLACQEGCKQCNYNQELCQECLSGYYLYMKSCVSIPSHCLSTNDNGFCYLCETQIFYDTQRDQFQDESDNEVKNYTDGQYSIFYKSVNGYCLKCSDYNTGQYFCPDSCTNSINMYVPLMIISLFHILL